MRYYEDFFSALGLVRFWVLKPKNLRPLHGGVAALAPGPAAWEQVF